MTPSKTEPSASREFESDARREAARVVAEPIKGVGRVKNRLRAVAN